MYTRVTGDEQCFWCLKYMTHGIANVYAGRKFCSKSRCAYAYSRLTRSPKGDPEQEAIRMATMLIMGYEPDDPPDGAAPAMVAA